MFRQSKPFLGAAVGLMLLSPLICWAAAFNVYYRTSPSGPWIFYSGAATKAQAMQEVTTLQGLGFLAESVAAGIAPGVGPGVAGSATFGSSAIYGPSAYNDGYHFWNWH